MPECWTVWHPVSLVPDRKKMPMPRETVWYQGKGKKSGPGMLRYLTEMFDGWNANAGSIDRDAVSRDLLHKAVKNNLFRH
jgi:hypothetical protein